MHVERWLSLLFSRWWEYNRITAVNNTMTAVAKVIDGYLSEVELTICDFLFVKFCCLHLWLGGTHLALRMSNNMQTKVNNIIIYFSIKINESRCTIIYEKIIHMIYSAINPYDVHMKKETNYEWNHLLCSWLVYSSNHIPFPWKKQNLFAYQVGLKTIFFF